MNKNLFRTGVLCLLLFTAGQAKVSGLEADPSGEIIADLEELEAMLPSGHTIYSVRLRGDTVFLMTHQAGPFISSAHNWKAHRLRQKGKPYATGYWLDLDIGYSVGKSRFDYPVNFWRYNWKTRTLDEIPINFKGRVLGFDVSPDSDMIHAQLLSPPNTREIEAVYDLASGKTTILEKITLRSFVWGMNGHNFAGISYGSFWVPPSLESSDLIVGDGEGGLRKFKLDDRIWLHRPMAWLDEHTLLLKAPGDENLGRSAKAYAVDIRSGELTEKNEYLSDHSVGPEGKAVVRRGESGYQIYRVNGAGSLPFILDKEFSFSLYNLSWSALGERVYFFVRSVPMVADLLSGSHREFPGDTYITDFRLFAGWDGEDFYCLKYDQTSGHVVLVSYKNF